MKRTRGWRIQQKEKVIKKRVKAAKVLLNYNNDDKLIQEPHRMLSKHPLDCGNAKCVLCHGEKLGIHESIRDSKHLTVEQELEVSNLESSLDRELEALNRGENTLTPSPLGDRGDD